jgi:hypothetical protein
VGLLAGAPSVWAQAAPPADPLEYGIFGLETVTLGRGGRVVGALGVNDGTAKLARGAQVDGVVAADIVRLGKRASVGALTCTLVIGGNGVCDLHSGPLVPQSTLAVVQVMPGLSDVVVPPRSRRVPLPANSYRRIRVGRGSTLLLEGGEYQIESIKLAARSLLSCMSTCRLAVAHRLRLGRSAVISGGDGNDPDLVRVDVQGERRRSSIRIGARARITGTLYAPTADARIGGRARLSGPVVARSVRTGAGIRVERP